MKSRSFQRRSFLLLTVAAIILLGTIVQQIMASQPLEDGSDAAVTAPSSQAPSTQSLIERYQEALRTDPDDADSYALLGLALLQRVRETGDASLYDQAEAAFSNALARQPQQLDALVGQGMLALARHDFTAALRWGEQARERNPYRAEALGILVDGQVELGRYDQAVRTAQAMVDLRPDVASYSRVSYLRELHGDTDGAIEAMQAAVDTVAPGSEAMLWTLVQLGHLYFNSGDHEQAGATYQLALQHQPDYAHAAAGLARVQAAGGELEAAVATYEAVVERLPLPEFLIPLAELHELLGDADEAQRQRDLVRTIQQLNQAAGMDVDLELALFDADTPKEAYAQGLEPALTLQRAQSVYDQRPTIYAADVLAWALYQNGQYGEAWQYSQEALRLGTRDALLHYHAGIIASALGDDEAAQQHLSEALAINPAFSIRYAPHARLLLGK